MHEIQKALEKPVQIKPEAMDIHWLSNYRTVHSVFLSFKSIMVAWEHIHKNSADLGSFASVILLEMINISFIVRLMKYLSNAVSNIGKILQMKTPNISFLHQLFGQLIIYKKLLILL